MAEQGKNQNQKKESAGKKDQRQQDRKSSGTKK